MVQIIEQTHEETIKMYMRFPKKDLVLMLIEANRVINRPTQRVTSGSGVIQDFRTTTRG